MKISKRLQMIASMVHTEHVIDVGCDHGLLDVFLAKTRNIHCLACDISDNALNQAKENIKLYGMETLVQTLCTDGLTDVQVTKDDTVILSGMGTHTVIHILEKRNDVEQCIISTHTDVSYLRYWMNQNGFAIQDECFILEHGIAYVIISFSKKEIQYDESDYEIGPILKTNLSYLTYLLNETQKIYQKIPLTHKIQKEKLKEKIDMIKFCIKKAE